MNEHTSLWPRIIADGRPGSALALAIRQAADGLSLMIGCFLNEIALVARSLLRPSPPAVMADMLGAILEVVASAAPLQEKLLIVESELAIGASPRRLRLWILPEHALS